MPFTKTGLLKCKKRDFLSYNTYDVCGHTLAESACTSTSRLHKDRHSVDLLEVSNLGNPSGSGPKKGYKRVESKNMRDKRATRTKSTKQRIISSVSSTELAKLERLTKFNNQREVPYGQSLEPKPSQSEQQLQP